MIPKRLTTLIAAGALTLALALPSYAQKNPTATFNVAGDILTVTLTENGSAASLPADVLTALFFNVAGNKTLTQVSAFTGPTSSVVVNDGTTTSNVSGQGANFDVGGEWDYLNNSSSLLTATGGHQSYGISSAGFGLFGNGSFPNTTGNLQGPSSGAVDGVQYGIVNGISGANGGLQNENEILNQVVFKFSGATGLNSGSFTDLGYIYGTAPGEGCVNNCGGGFVPEPAFYQMGGLLFLGGFGGFRLRRKARKAA